jgi:hypothetical protein
VADSATFGGVGQHCVKLPAGLSRIRHELGAEFTHYLCPKKEFAMHPVTLIGTILLAIGTVASALLLGTSTGHIAMAGTVGLWIVFLTGVTLGLCTLPFGPQAPGAFALRAAGSVTMLVSLIAMALQLAAYAGVAALGGLGAIGLWPLAITAFVVGATELIAGYGMAKMPEATA